jgi:hypothetical protein
LPWASSRPLPAPTPSSSCWPWPAWTAAVR